GPEEADSMWSMGWPRKRPRSLPRMPSRGRAKEKGSEANWRREARRILECGVRGLKRQVPILSEMSRLSTVPNTALCAAGPVSQRLRILQVLMFICRGEGAEETQEGSRQREQGVGRPGGRACLHARCETEAGKQG